jgi:hypothetical protein
MGSLWFWAQMLYSASAFNQNLGGWNVLRVTTLIEAFKSTALADCYKRGIYSSWGSMLQAAYPTWRSLALCTARCAMLAARMHTRVRMRVHAPLTARLLCVYLYRKLLATYPRFAMAVVLRAVDGAVTPHFVHGAQPDDAQFADAQPYDAQHKD